MRRSRTCEGIWRALKNPHPEMLRTDEKSGVTGRSSMTMWAGEMPGTPYQIMFGISGSEKQFK